MEIIASDNFRIDGLDRSDATPQHGVDLGALNAKNLKAQDQHIPVEEGGKCTEFPCFRCFPIDGCSG